MNDGQNQPLACCYKLCTLKHLKKRLIKHHHKKMTVIGQEFNWIGFFSFELDTQEAFFYQLEPWRLTLWDINLSA